MWRKPKDETTKERLLLGNWRESRLAPDSGDTTGSERVKGTGDAKGMLGSWRVRREVTASEVDVPVVYGGSMPTEWKLQRMYKQLKVDNTNFITWLVESVYPSIESLPSYITLSRKQAKGERELDPVRQ